MESPKSNKSSNSFSMSPQSPKSSGYSSDVQKPCNFLIEGTIGAGKSTFLERLNSLPVDVSVIPEPVHIWTNYEGHNYLELFYKNTKKYAFPFQQLAVNTAVNAYKDGIQQNPNAHRFYERSVFSPLKIFGKEQYNAGVLEEPEYELLKKITQDTVRWVDYDIQGIIYIKTSPQIAQDRVVKRSRKEDSGIPIEYLNHLHNLHEQWLVEDKSQKYPVLTYLNDSTTTVDNFAKVEAAIQDWIQNPVTTILDPTNI